MFIKFDTTTSVVIIALHIASFTYGGLISLFILSKLKKKFYKQSILCGYLGSIMILLIINFYDIKFTYFIAIAIMSNFIITYFINFYCSALIDKRFD